MALIDGLMERYIKVVLKMGLWKDLAPYLWKMVLDIFKVISIEILSMEK